MNKIIPLILICICAPLLSQYNAISLPDKGGICLLANDSVEVKGDDKAFTITEDLFRPFGLDPLPDGTFLIADSGNSLIKLIDASGQLINSFGGKGSGDSALLRPLGVFSDAGGRLIVSDTGNDCVKVFDRNGVFLFKFGKRGYGDSELLNPFHIFKGKDNSIFVVDPGNICVKKFSPSGKFLLKFSDRLLSASDAAAHPDGSIYVCDFLDRSVKIYSADGKFKGYYKDRYYYTAPALIAINSQGDIAVSDTGTGRLEVTSAGNKVIRTIDRDRDLRARQVFSAAAGKDGAVYCTDFSGDYFFKQVPGGSVSAFGGHGTAPGLFNLAKGIGINSKGNIFVSDSFNGRIEQFDPAGKFAAEYKGFDWPMQLAAGPDDNIYISETGRSLIRKIDASGKTLQEIKPGEYFNPGPLAVDAALNIGVVNTLNKNFVMLDPSGKALMSFSFENKWPVSVAAGADGEFYVFDALESMVFALNKGGLVSKAKLDLQGHRRQKYGVLIFKEGKLFFFNPNQLSKVVFPSQPSKQP